MLDTQELSSIVISTLDEAKAVDIKKIDVRKLTDITDEMISCHGTSDRHVRALTRIVTDTLARHGCKAASIEGEEEGGVPEGGRGPMNVDFSTGVVGYTKNLYFGSLKSLSAKHNELKSPVFGSNVG